MEISGDRGATSEPWSLAPWERLGRGVGPWLQRVQLGCWRLWEQGRTLRRVSVKPRPGYPSRNWLRHCILFGRYKISGWCITNPRHSCLCTNSRPAERCRAEHGTPHPFSSVNPGTAGLVHALTRKRYCAALAAWPAEGLIAGLDFCQAFNFFLSPVRFPALFCGSPFGRRNTTAALCDSASVLCQLVRRKSQHPSGVPE